MVQSSRLCTLIVTSENTGDLKSALHISSGSISLNVLFLVMPRTEAYKSALSRTVYSWANPSCWRSTLPPENSSRARISEVIFHHFSSFRVVLEVVRNVEDFQVDRSHCLSGSDRRHKSHDLSLDSETRSQGFVPNPFEWEEQLLNQSADISSISLSGNPLTVAV